MVNAGSALSRVHGTPEAVVALSIIREGHLNYSHVPTAPCSGSQLFGVTCRWQGRGTQHPSLLPTQGICTSVEGENPFALPQAPRGSRNITLKPRTHVEGSRSNLLAPVTPPLSYLSASCVFAQHCTRPLSSHGVLFQSMTVIASSRPGAPPGLVCKR